MNWTEKENEILIEKYPTDYTMIPELLKRHSMGSIRVKAISLHVKLIPKYRKQRMQHAKGKKFSEEHKRKMGCLDQKGGKNPNWKGGKTGVGDRCMIKSEEHPFKNSLGYIYERRLIMEEWLRKNNPDYLGLIKIRNKLYIRKEWHVHYKNKKDGNKISNLRTCGKLEKNCDKCGKTIKAFTSKIKKNKHIFCSPKCANEYNIGENNSFYGKKHTKETIEKMSKDKIDRTCPNCGKTFGVLLSYIEIGAGIYCSRKCQNEYQRGENAPGWKGGLYPSYGSMWRKSRKEALREAKHASEMSRTNGGRLDVHHIYQLRRFYSMIFDMCYTPYFDEISFQTMSTVFNIPDVVHEEANDLDNLIVLTINEHQKYGDEPPSFFYFIKHNF